MSSGDINEVIPQQGLSPSLLSWAKAEEDLALMFFKVHLRGMVGVRCVCVCVCLYLLHTE